MSRTVKLQHELATTSAASRVLLAATISQYGDWLTTVALVTVLYQATNSAIGPAAYMLFRVGPRILGAAPAGYMADRFRPQWVAAVACATQGVITAAILLALAWNRNTPTIYIAVGLAQVAGAALRPLFPALIGIHTPSRRRGTFNAIDQVAAESAVFIAPAIGAALLSQTGPTMLLAIDCATFAISAAILLTLPMSQPGGFATTLLGQGSTVGFRHVWRRPPLRLTASAFAVSGAVVTTLQAVLVVAAATSFGGANNLGYCYSAVGIGGMLGGALALRWRHREVTALDIYTTALCELAPIAVLSLVHSIAPALILLAVSSVGGVVNYTFATTYMQNDTPLEIISRVSAALTTVNYIGMLVGALVALILASTLGWQKLILGFTVLCVLLLTGGALAGRNRVSHEQTPAENLSSSG